MWLLKTSMTKTSPEIKTNFLLYKSKKTIWMFYGKFADEGENPVDNQNKYNV